MKKLLTICVAALCAVAAYAGANPEVVCLSDAAQINTNDPTDFVSLYVKYGDDITTAQAVSGSTLSILWEKSTDSGDTYETYMDGKGYNTNNIRPRTPGRYRCTLTVIPTAGDPVVRQAALDVTGTAGDARSFTTNLPIVVIETNKDDHFMAEPDDANGYLKNNETLAAAKAKHNADCKIIWNGKKKDGSEAIYSASDFASTTNLYYDKKIRINFRGSSSMAKGKTKRNYAFTVGADNCTDEGKWVKDKKNMFDLNAKDKDWILYGSNDDGSLMRNILQLQLYEDMSGNWNPHNRYVRLIVDGVDKGIYIFMEKIVADKKRVPVQDDGYMFKLDKNDIADRFNSSTNEGCTFTSNSEFTTCRKDISTYGLTVDHNYEIVFPEADDFDTPAEWGAKVTALQTKINAFETAVKNNNYTTLRTLIDYESFADYFIIQELAKNADGYRLSQNFYILNSTGLINAEPLWDTEFGLDNANAAFYSDKGCGTANTMIYENAAMHNDDFAMPFWWNGYGRNNAHVGSSNGLLGDACFKAKIKQRWLKHTATGGALTQTNIDKYLDQYAVSTSVSTHNTISNWLYGDKNRIANLTTTFGAYDEIISAVALYVDVEGVHKTELEVNLGDAVTITCDATKTSGSSSETLTYKWEQSTDEGKNWTTIEGATAATYNATIADNTWFRARAIPGSCDCIKKVSDNFVKVTIPNTVVTCK